jgi:arylsulfatase A-like enzyme
LRGFKATTLEGGIRVPFCAQWKGKIPAGSTYDQPIIQLDILPTALAAAGGKVDAKWQLDGVNLLPYLTGDESGQPHSMLYWRFGQQWAIRKGDWKLVASRIDGNRPQLFNLADDIGEAHDLIAEQSTKAEELRKDWEQWNAEQVPARWLPNANAKNQKKKKKQAN